MTHLRAGLTLVLLFGAFAETRAQNDGEEKPVTMSRALKLGIEGLLDEGNPSEAGQDRAAQLYAIARRLETENALAGKNLRQVLILDDWREALVQCRRGSCDLAYILNGGGTMYTHGAARDVAEVEDFLARFSKSLPLAPGKGSAEAGARIDAAIAFLKTLKAYESGDATTDKEAIANLAAERERVIGHWEILKYMVSDIPAHQAEKIVAFAENSLSWLKDE